VRVRIDAPAATDIRRWNAPLVADAAQEIAVTPPHPDCGGVYRLRELTVARE